MYDVAIIGAGPAGASAALFIAKAGKHVLLVDNDKSITKRAWMENHYGVMEISGPDLMETGINQAKRFGAEVTREEVQHIKKEENGFILQGEKGSYSAQQVILATGMSTDLGAELGLEIVPGTEPRVKSIYKVDEEGRASLPGVWAAGICAGVSLHTIITAGDGAKVAINLLSAMNGQRYVDHDVFQPK
ncbi:FAD-dependent oxidoreductase [Rubeoparvulum massiliense]|uniref:FAD-dependent oxidoreductase n=1 Tax=Rubeoparvulum massiliense TaxID=1631346 RepID=UPI00065E7F79|nr:FAD-dependent oxidoreductase [Rubeoparvulum massiliense]